MHLKLRFRWIINPLSNGRGSQIRTSRTFLNVCDNASEIKIQVDYKSTF